MGKLDGAKGYLAGAITYVDDDGVCWRKELKKYADILIPRLSFLDPTDKPMGLGSEIGFEKGQAKKWKQDGEYDKLTRHVKKYRRYDLRMTDEAQFLIWYIDLDIFTVGSIDETINCEKQKKPLFAIIKQGKKNAPDWLFAMMKHQEMFESIQECVDYLAKLDSGEIEMDERWVLYNGLCGASNVS